MYELRKGVQTLIMIILNTIDEDEGRWTESILLHFDKLTLTDLTDDELLQVTTKISNMEKKQNG